MCNWCPLPDHHPRSTSSAWRDGRTQTRHKSRNLHNAKVDERRLFCRRGTTFARVRFPNQVLRVRGALADLVFLHGSLGICLSLQIAEYGGACALSSSAQHWPAAIDRQAIKISWYFLIWPSLSPIVALSPATGKLEERLVVGVFSCTFLMHTGGLICGYAGLLGRCRLDTV
jgi:hypothetical protein